MKIAVFGAGGRVGAVFCRLAKEKGHRTTEIEANNAANAAQSAEADVVVDFSAPSALPYVLQLCRRCRAPLVCGTTGYTAEQQNQLEELKQTVDVLYSSNFSRGVAALRQAAALIAEQLPDFDIRITEIHRKNKKDSPSGTAKDLARLLHTDEIHSLRCGTVFGTHLVTFAGDGETLTLVHNAENTEVFARGALQAAEKLYQKGAHDKG